MSYVCTQTQCKCIQGATFCGGPGVTIDLTTAIDTLEGGLSFECPYFEDGKDGANSNCTFILESLRPLFPEGLKLPSCTFGECVSEEDNPRLANSGGVPSITAGAAVGVGIAGAAVLGAIIGLIFARIQQVQRKKLPIPPQRAGVDITFEKIHYKVGKARAGHVLAIMGPSGAGKSTLLDILAGKSKSGSIEGQILVGGRKTKPDELKRIAGFVDQEDVFLPTMTVWEALMFSARLRLPESMTHEDRVKRVQEVVDELGLGRVVNSRIGGAGGARGISGGEKRRVSVGVELITSPSVLFLDEPTSGLDSYNALLVVQTLVNLAKHFNKTVVFTIHQPRSDVFTLFDDVLVLSQGTTIYRGRASDASPYFADRGKPCPPGYNIADHLLDLASVSKTPKQSLGSLPNSSPPAVSEKSGIKFGWKKVHNASDADEAKKEEAIVADSSGAGMNVPKDQWRTEEGNESTDGKLKSNGQKGAEESDSGDAEAEEKQQNDRQPQHHDEQISTSFLTQLVVLSDRAWKKSMRQPTLILSHIVAFIALGYSIPSPVNWIQYLSFFYYAYEAVAVNEINGLTLIDNINGVEVRFPAVIILREFGFDPTAYWRDFAVCCGLIIAELIILALLIRYAVKEKR
ncbi:hypothetical protein HK102_013397 [Quaeritorhiza haematococci]|nr:hypothetical protein HK102_013397 [Quaeritorhiza haematococci]